MPQAAMCSMIISTGSAGQWWSSSWSLWSGGLNWCMLALGFFLFNVCENDHPGPMVGCGPYKCVQLQGQWKGRPWCKGVWSVVFGIVLCQRFLRRSICGEVCCKNFWAGKELKIVKCWKRLRTAEKWSAEKCWWTIPGLPDSHCKC
jgi:hypothetical protein